MFIKQDEANRAADDLTIEEYKLKAKRSFPVCLYDGCSYALSGIEYKWDTRLPCDMSDRKVYVNVIVHRSRLPLLLEIRLA